MTGPGEDVTILDEEPETATPGEAVAMTPDEGGPSHEPEELPDALLPDGATMFSRWERIQGRFVDEPRTAVEEADSLVAEVVDHLTDAFAVQRERLEMQWKAGDDVSTEELRQALRRYRAFFERLVAV